jgi:ankyrin repeat protein
VKSTPYCCCSPLARLGRDEPPGSVRDGQRPGPNAVIRRASYTSRQPHGNQVKRSHQVEDDWYEKEQLHFAASDGDLPRVKQLVESGDDVNLFDDLSYAPLHYAAKGEFFAVAQYLIAAGADVNAHDEEHIGETPLGAVAASCSYEMAKLLVDAGANPTIAGWMNLTALYRAKERKKEEGQKGLRSFDRRRPA